MNEELPHTKRKGRVTCGRRKRFRVDRGPSTRGSSAGEDALEPPSLRMTSKTRSKVKSQIKISSRSFASLGMTSKNEQQDQNPSQNQQQVLRFAQDGILRTKGFPGLGSFS